MTSQGYTIRDMKMYSKLTTCMSFFFYPFSNTFSSKL